jgi:hypothetical protein
MKCSLRMLDVMWAMVSAGDRPAWPGTGKVTPTPAAVAPMITILSAYLLAGILPFSTSKKESIANGGLPSRSL